MQLKLAELQKVVKSVVNNGKHFDALKAELTYAIGPTVVTTHGLKIMAESANDQLDVMLRTGRQPKAIKTAVLLKFINSEESEARRLAARLLPENFIRSMVNDADYLVRLAAAERLPSTALAATVKSRPNDDQLHAIYHQKKLFEAGLPTPKAVDQHLDVNGELPLGDTARYEDHPGMTDQWYDSHARDFIKLYGKNLERNWEETSVNNYFNALKTSSEFDVDKDKLLDKVYDLLAQRDKKVLELKEGSLAAIAKSLRQQDMVESASFPIISLDRDEVQSLIEGMLPPREYIKKFEDIFSVEKKAVENPGRKQGINENVLKIVSPYSATFPKSRIRPCDEKAVDMYVKHWNSQRMLKNQQYKISWSPLDNETVTFKLGTR